MQVQNKLWVVSALTNCLIHGNMGPLLTDFSFIFPSRETEFVEIYVDLPIIKSSNDGSLFNNFLMVWNTKSYEGQVATMDYQFLISPLHTSGKASVLVILYWSIADLQYCASFRCIA